MSYKLPFITWSKGSLNKLLSDLEPGNLSDLHPGNLSDLEPRDINDLETGDLSDLEPPLVSLNVDVLVTLNLKTVLIIFDLGHGEDPWLVLYIKFISVWLFPLLWQINSSSLSLHYTVCIYKCKLKL